MKTLHKDAISNSSFAVVLVGLHGVGKTTLFWLCFNLEDIGAIAIPFNIDTIKKFSDAPPKILWWI